MNLPFSVHTREALEDTYRILKDEKISDIGGIMHSFSGDAEWMKKFLDLGLHISFSGVVTFKRRWMFKKRRWRYHLNECWWKQMHPI